MDHTTNAIAEHAHTHNHTIDWDNAAIVAKEKNVSLRRLLESLIIQSTPATINRTPVNKEPVCGSETSISSSDLSDPTLILEYQKDLREECGQFGEVKKVVVYDRHPEGVATVTFKEPEEADACISRMNGRWFAQRQLTAETWDGRTRYKIFETEEELEERLKKWDDFLEADEDEKAKGSSSDASVAPSTSAIKREAEDSAETEARAQKRPNVAADDSTE